VISRISEAQRSKEKLMQAACFRCRDTKPRTDLTHEEFIAALASIGRPETQTFFVISCNASLPVIFLLVIDYYWMIMIGHNFRNWSYLSRFDSSARCRYLIVVFMSLWRKICWMVNRSQPFRTMIDAGVCLKRT